MIKTPSKNIFISDEENRIRNLAYYGEFFANLDFDDGFRAIVYKALERYILNLEIENITLDLELSDTSADISNNVKVIIESDNFSETTATDLLTITTTLQADFHLTPIVQSYPFVLDSEVELPVEVDLSEKDDNASHRHTIQKAQADIYILEKTLKKLKQRTEILKDTDEISVKALIENWNTLIPQLENKIVEQKMEFQNLIATKYIEMSVESIDNHTTTHTISAFEADAFLDVQNGRTQERSSRILGWLNQGKDLLELQQDQITNLTKKLTTLTESIGEKAEVEVKIEKGILTNVKMANRKFKSATILGTKTEIYHNEVEIIGFKLDGVSQLLNIEGIRTSKKDVITSFSAILPNNIIQRFYLNKNSEYTPLRVGNQKNFSYIRVIGYDNDFKPLYGSLKDLEGKVKYFQRDENGKYNFTRIEGVDTFDSISMYYNENAGHIKNIKGNKQYFQKNKDGKYMFIEIGGKKEFENIEGDSDSSYLPMYCWISENDKCKYCYQNPDSKKDEISYETLEIEGECEFKEIKILYSNDKTKKPISGRVKTKDDFTKYFFTNKNGKYTFLNINGVSEFLNFSEFDNYKTPPKEGRISNKEGNAQFFYIQNGEYTFLNINGSEEFDKLSVDKKRDISGSPLTGSYVALGSFDFEKNYKRIKFNLGPSFMKKIFSI